ncbi:hypothetical protein NSK_004007 [Nannochloropsis salina CCMP1776]|uniref:Uncharacterized protein n=2 Tax=Monodopsidaceae TaxID=425072 RepID=W7TBC4_9STRA|nr:hypothetical protein NGA_0222900 [Nannochloropsis gaditana CCMP526]EKU21981.1 hypothetical protein NGA_0222900 [Nannochloropsis gaditana CCMP526]EWM23522.1 hypothetical protein Naga_101879g1 [Nannochloropsis gaditana]TFJ84541.1 hypothetical protein NSK_004007 [Nannochloropsis salina CCMP1776]|eukprot:TFJ84541.1 hypothetical protein NSK_004007 [Nannochloropsis salina CCMP1776]
MPGFSLRSQDAWRNHPMLASGFKRPIPNFTLACGIFLGLVAVDWANKAINGDGHHHANPVSVTFVDDIDGPSTTVIEESKGSHGARH